ncbi:MAG TPA: hypothetical protein PLX17_08490 [Chitinophagaceae bacterium]|nr:hypothetical protein [Chitinophagaceae bacterium]
MKKYYISSLLVAATVIFSYCNSAKKATAIEIRPTYENGVASLITTHCTPCHITEKAGKKKAFDNYVNVKMDIDEIIRRIELSPGEKGFMPFKKQEKLSDSTVNVFKKWRDQGLVEK